jgi:hypothetical protein
VQRAIAVIKATDEARAKSDKSSSYSNRSHTTTTVRANVMEEGEYDDEYERGEGELAELNQMQGTSRSRGGQNGRERRAPKTLLYTPEEWAKVKKLELCFHCGKSGHKVGECKDRKEAKPKTKATAAQLNA